MYLEKLKFFHTQYPEDKCISGITTTQFNGVPVGTPGMIRVDPFHIFDPDSKPTEMKTIGQPRWAPSGEDLSSPPPGEKSGKKSSGLDLRKIAEENVRKANRIISSSISKATLFLPFAVHSSDIDYQSCMIHTRNFHINGSVPLIYDKCKHMKMQRLSDIHDTSEISSFSDVLSESLKEYRYVNYTFVDLARSTKKYILEDLNTLYNALSRAYSYKVSIFQFPHDRLNAILDVLSISFYRIADVIPIFDSKRSEGICMEIFAANSRMTSDTLMREHNAATFRLLFAKSKENLFTIDGEVIQRPCDIRASTVLSNVASLIAQDVPNDKDVKKLTKSMSSTKEEA